ncbi:hypothetical protein [Flavobacterium sp.]|uniref:hypothetical protein n=1 Tax=Flavobacterium sp. TaxID=239 RepID=UPI0026201F66|nr:hypothetical protein [Flavobacterium sp.]
MIASNQDLLFACKNAIQMPILDESAFFEYVFSCVRQKVVPNCLDSIILEQVENRAQRDRSFFSELSMRLAGHPVGTYILIFRPYLSPGFCVFMSDGRQNLIKGLPTYSNEPSSEQLQFDLYAAVIPAVRLNMQKRLQIETGRSCIRKLDLTKGMAFKDVHLPSLQVKAQKATIQGIDHNNGTLRLLLKIPGQRTPLVTDVPAEDFALRAGLLNPVTDTGDLFIPLGPSDQLSQVQ